MPYQDELECIMCGSIGRIRKVRLKNVFMYGDEHTYFCCEACCAEGSKFYGQRWQSLVTNAEDFPIMLDEEWKWADEDILKEVPKEEDIIDLNKEDIEKELDKVKDPNLRKAIEDMVKTERRHRK